MVVVIVHVMGTRVTGQVMSNDERDTTVLLSALADGDRSAAERLFPLVYDELRALAERHFRREARDHTLQPTALVHEASLRLVDCARCTGHSAATSARWSPRPSSACPSGAIKAPRHWPTT